MTHWRVAFAAMVTLAFTACVFSSASKSGSAGQTTRSVTDVYDSVYLTTVYGTADRNAGAPDGYGLYTVLLTRTVNPNTTRVMSELFATTGNVRTAAIDRPNLNLITIPVKNVGEADGDLESARMKPDAAAATMMQKHYDFDLAARLMSSVCGASRGAAAVEVCGSTTTAGPFLVSSQHNLGGSIPAGEKLLIVNLSNTPPGAIPTVLAAYRKQILRKDFADRVELDSWRLQALNYFLEAAKLLPRIKKAYAGLIAP